MIKIILLFLLNQTTSLSYKLSKFNKDVLFCYLFSFCPVYHLIKPFQFKSLSIYLYWTKLWKSIWSILLKFKNKTATSISTSKKVHKNLFCMTHHHLPPKFPSKNHHLSSSLQATSIISESYLMRFQVWEKPWIPNTPQMLQKQILYISFSTKMKNRINSTISWGKQRASGQQKLIVKNWQVIWQTRTKLLSVKMISATLTEEVKIGMLIDWMNANLQSTWIKVVLTNIKKLIRK